MSYVMFDLETGGLSVDKHPIIQIGAIATDHNLNVIDTFECKIIPGPGEEVDPRAAEINGYEEEKWACEGIPRAEADAKLADWLHKVGGGTRVRACCHNSDFDSKYCRRWLPNSWRYFMDLWICTQWSYINYLTLECHRARTKDGHLNLRPAGTKRPNAVRYFGGEEANGHDAFGDCRDVLFIIRALVNKDPLKYLCLKAPPGSPAQEKLGKRPILLSALEASKGPAN